MRIAESPCILKYVRTGPNSWQGKGISYLTKDAKPQRTILLICVVDATAKMTTPGEIEWTMTKPVYLGSQDKDLDGLPDADEKPISVIPLETSHWKAF